MTLQLGPHEQRIIPEAIDFLRTNGVEIGPRYDDRTRYKPYLGALRITVFGTATENVFAGARTVFQFPAGGLFGLFTPGVYSGAEACTEAYLYGLRVDSETGTFVDVVNTGGDSDGPILLQFQVYDGDAGGIAKGYPVNITLRPGRLDSPDQQFWEDSFFGSSGVANGWVKVSRMSGTAPWIVYAETWQRGTGDRAYVPMVK